MYDCCNLLQLQMFFIALWAEFGIPSAKFKPAVDE
jgi:hypothetical protein